MEATYSSEMSVDFQQTTRRYIPEARKYSEILALSKCSGCPTPWEKFLAVPKHISSCRNVGAIESQHFKFAHFALDSDTDTHCAVKRYLCTHQLLQLKNSEKTFLSVSLTKSRSGVYSPYK
jgi:hypothetical protein